jgi:hypothetical protein
LIDGIFFVILITALLLNLIENEEDIGMTLGLTLGMKILLFSARSVFLIAVALYLYFLSRRKKQDVVVQMWACIIVGMLAGLAITLLPVVIGTATWASIQYSFLLYAAFFVYAIWKVLILIKARRH